MRIFYYAANQIRTGQLMWQLYMDRKPGLEPIICRTLHHLRWQLKLKAMDHAIAVLLVSRVKDLRDLLAMKHLLNGMRIILILPNDDSETVSLGYKLHPRYMGCFDDDSRDIYRVLDKMLENIGLQPALRSHQC